MHIYANFYVTAGQTPVNSASQLTKPLSKTGRLNLQQQSWALVYIKRVFFLYDLAQNNAPFFTLERKKEEYCLKTIRKN